MNRFDFLKATSADILLPQFQPIRKFWNIPVAVRSICSKGTVFAIDNPPRMHMGWVAYENIGIAITNPKCITQLTIITTNPMGIIRDSVPSLKGVVLH